MAKIQCKICGGQIELQTDRKTGECPYCGSFVAFTMLVDVPTAETAPVSPDGSQEKKPNPSDGTAEPEDAFSGSSAESAAAEAEKPPEPTWKKALKFIIKFGVSAGILAYIICTRDIQWKDFKLVNPWCIAAAFFCICSWLR